MNSDINGCSTCQPGQEQYEEFRNFFSQRMNVQYDYRTPKGKLFSCIAPTLEIARDRRDKWLNNLSTIDKKGD